MVRLSLILAGEHIVKIVAATTKGLETSRTCKLVVLPAEGDANVTVSAADMANVPVGATIRLVYEMADILMAIMPCVSPHLGGAIMPRIRS